MTVPADIATTAVAVLLVALAAILTAVLLGHIANPPRRTTRPAPKGTR